MKIGVLCSRVRVEEKLLVEALRRRGHEAPIVDDRAIYLDLDRPQREYDAVLERCVHHSRAVSALKIFETWGVPTVNRYEVAETCGNKFLVTEAILKAGLPTPKTAIAFYSQMHRLTKEQQASVADVLKKHIEAKRSRPRK